MVIKIVMILSYLLFCVSSYAMAPIADCLTKRHSGRFYDSSRSVSQSQINSLMEAARRAPSCYNDQPWNFIFCDRTADPESYQKALQCLVEFNQNWAKNAPLLIIAVAGKKFHHNQTPNRWAEYDTGAAALSICIEASANGLMAHQMGGFDQEKIAKEFQIPQEFTTLAVIAVGYEEKGKENASARSERISFKENFFKGKWK